MMLRLLLDELCLLHKADLKSDSRSPGGDIEGVSLAVVSSLAYPERRGSWRKMLLTVLVLDGCVGEELQFLIL